MYLAYEHGGAWQVRELTPREFRSLDEWQVDHCFWRQQQAVDCATEQNRVLLSRACLQADTLRASLMAVEDGPAP